MNFSINPLTFQTENIDNEKNQRSFLYKLSALLGQMVLVMSSPLDISKAANATVSPWTVFTCTLTSGAGTITSQTSNTSFLQIGKLVFVNGTVQVTNIGTASGNMFFSLPVAAKRIFAFDLREITINGLIYSATFFSSTTMIVQTSANAAPTWANNFQLAMSFSYEAV